MEWSVVEWSGVECGAMVVVVVVEIVCKVPNPWRLPRKSTNSECRKMFQARQSFIVLTWTCALCHTGVHF